MFRRFGDYNDLKMMAIITNLSTLIICKNGQSILSTKSNIISVIYFCKIACKSYYLRMIILITEKLLSRISNWAHKNVKNEITTK